MFTEVCPGGKKYIIGGELMAPKTHAFLILLSLPDVHAQFALQLSCLLAAILPCCRDGGLLSLLNRKSKELLFSKVPFHSTCVITIEL